MTANQLMKPRVLILSCADDIHAHAVELALKQLGVPVEIWYTADFPAQASETIRFSGGQCSLEFTQRVTERVTETNSAYSVVWNRRPSHSIRSDLVHPADLPFVSSECGIFRRAFMELLCPDSFWVNRHGSALRANLKPVQQLEAQRVGFLIPNTIYSNDPSEIREFLSGNGGRIIYKPQRAVSWEGRDCLFATFTTELSEEALADKAMLSAVPGIYQEVVPKRFELRVTVIGDELFAAKVLSQETSIGKTDWRRAYGDLKFEPFTLTSELAGACCRLVRNLGLVFGCLDLIVTPKGDTVFLEVNEMGQFLFIESQTGMPLLAGFCEMLRQGRPDWTWPAAPRIDYRKLFPEAVERMARLGQAHQQPPRLAIPDAISQVDSDAHA